MEDERFMSMALRLARRGLGNVFPNPAVGCVIVQNKVVVGRGWTVAGGRPHAEVVALKHAGKLAEGATAYVSLEPCCHDGVSGPCTTEIIKAGVRRVVVGIRDPDLRVSGRGISILKEAGIDVKYGVMLQQCEELNAGFFQSKLIHRPLITAKLAVTLDGKISLGSQDERWITNDLTRKWVHKQRSMYDAIMVGSNTVLKDDPMLDCRLPGLERHSPIRIVIDRSGKLQPHHRLIKTADLIPTYLVVEEGYSHTLLNVQYIKIKSGEQFLENVMQKLTLQMGITRLFVEGGSILITELLKRKLIDRFIWTRAARICGARGLDSILDIGAINDVLCKFVQVEDISFMDDKAYVFRVVYD